jgi:hypothetical protein
MRSSVKITLAVLSAVLLVTTSCKKSALAPVASNSSANTMAISKQIATNLLKSLGGHYGGANISDGIKAPSGVVVTPKGQRVNGIDPYCGFTIDTTTNFDTQVGDTLKNVDSKYKFIYTCSTNALDGYVLSDTVTYTDKGALFLNKYIIGQNYIVNKASNDFSAVSMHGTLGTDIYLGVLNTSNQTTGYNKNNTQYVLSGLNINVAGATPDITVGTVTFNSHITYLEAGKTVTGGYSGTLTFIGNHKAHMTVTYNGVTTTYLFNLLNYDLDVI